MPDYAALAKQAEQEAAPAGGQDYVKMAQQAEMESNAPAPLSGPIGAAPLPEALQDTPQSNNRAALQSGTIGALKSIPQTVADVGGLVNKIPRIGEHIAPRAEVDAYDKYAQADNPQEEAGKIAGAGLQMITPFGEAAEALPNAGRAGKAISAVEDAARAKGVMVPLSRTSAPLQRITELSQRGHSVPQVAGQLLNRSQAISPMHFGEARDFYSGMASPSIWERMSVGGKARAEMGNLKSAFGGDIGAAADSIGQGDAYRQAMNEYRNAKRLQKIGGTVGAGALGYGAKAAGAGALLHFAGKLGAQ